MEQEKSRCPRCLKHPDYIRYHDEERGIPMHDESKHFEMLMLETMQAWLSWRTILQRREAYREAFAGFDPCAVAQFGEGKVQELMQNAGIIRNQAKIRAAIKNAQVFLDIQKEWGSFDAYIRSFTDGKIIHNHLRSMQDYTPTTELSDRVSKDMKKRWFSFVWSTTIYAHLQAIGVVDDHLEGCWKRE
jgi:DNA-3-methyladenine glycosylase I